MKILILGGTIFLGRHLVEAALARGHEITLFNRGQHNPDLFPEVEKLRGDRKFDLGALAGRRWEAVIDTSGYLPRDARASAEFLADKADHYTFISSISVYADFSKPGMAEDAPVDTAADPEMTEFKMEAYGALKAYCEEAAERAMPGRVLNIRPGLIVGPHDPTDRFTYWVVRVAEGGEVLAPASPEVQAQVIDARDLAEWNVRMIEAGQTGVYNATGPDYPLTLGRFLATCREVSGSDATFIWAEPDFLLQAGVAPWTEIPMWLPGDEYAGIDQINVTKAFQAGLTFRPMAQTIADTLAWNHTRPADHEWRAGLSRQREQELLERMKDEG